MAMSRTENPAQQAGGPPPAGVVVGDEIVYPESDGQPMADNTEQFDWIVSIKLNLEAVFEEREDVFVAGDLLWYPVEGEPKTRQAPDVLVAFGRPKGRRGSYLQWREDGVAPQVVFEVLSPGNAVMEMTRKLGFYERHVVEEYYVISPGDLEVTGWRREGGHLVMIEQMNGWVSPRLGIRFQAEPERVALFRPDGRPFESFVDVAHERDEQRRRAEESERRAERLAGKLREIGVDPDSL
jgi:Uma2 family endonuclease